MLFLATYLVTQIDGDDKNFGSNRRKFWFTLEFGIDVGQGITIGSGKFV